MDNSHYFVLKSRIERTTIKSKFRLPNRKTGKCVRWIVTVVPVPSVRLSEGTVLTPTTNIVMHRTLRSETNITRICIFDLSHRFCIGYIPPLLLFPHKRFGFFMSYLSDSGSTFHVSWLFCSHLSYAPSYLP